MWLSLVSYTPVRLPWLDRHRSNGPFSSAAGGVSAISARVPLYFLQSPLLLFGRRRFGLFGSRTPLSSLLN